MAEGICTPTLDAMLPPSPAAPAQNETPIVTLGRATVVRE